MEMRGFKQILHLSGSIRLKLCNQAHVPLLKQELFGRFFRRNSAILIIYLKATSPPFFFFLSLSRVCLFSSPPATVFFTISMMTQLHVLILIGTTWLKGKLPPFCCFLALVSGVNNILSVCACALPSVCEKSRRGHRCSSSSPERRGFCPDLLCI